MTDFRRSEELQRLQEQMAELTRRVYRLEQLLRTAANVESLAAKDVAPSTTPAQLGPSAIAPPMPVIAGEPPQSGAPTFLQAPSNAAQSAAPRVKPQVSLETRIGGQWLNRIGIIAVLVGLSYFLKLAIENNWIGAGTRVAIGIAAGVGLILWSERFRARGFAGFAYSLKAVGIGALYLSLWAAFQFYHLMPAAVAFLGMVLVTATSAAMSLRQDSELLAAFALVGGFLTPVLVSTNQNHEIALFLYVALLDLGTVWVVAVRGWRRLLLAGFIGTALLFVAWASSYYTEAQLATTLTFVSFFFLLYAAAPFLGRRTASGQPYPNLMVVLALLNAGAYFVATYLMLAGHYRFELAWLTVAVALLFFILTRTLQKTEGSAHPLFGPLYLALAVGFLTIAIPLKLDRYWLTLGWLVEGGALLWAAHRSRSLLLRVLGLAATALGGAHLIVVDSEVQQSLIFNPRFGLYLVAIAALALLAWLSIQAGGADNLRWAGGAIIAINILALVALHFEVTNYFHQQLAAAVSGSEYRSVDIVRGFSYSAVWMVYGSGLMLVGFWKRSAFVRWQAIVLLGATAIKVFFVDINTLERGYRIAAFIVLGAILLAVSFFYQRSRMRAAE